MESPARPPLPRNAGREYILLQDKRLGASAGSAAVARAGTITSTPLPKGKTITVTSTNDSGPGTFREALEDVQPYDTIIFEGSIRASKPVHQQ